MHYLPDTSDEDAASERYWPDGFKQVIREEVGRAIRPELNEQTLGHVYTHKFSHQYLNLEAFIERFVDLVVIGAENGADLGFNHIYQSFLNESPLPQARPYYSYYWPHFLSAEPKDKIGKAIAAEYSQEEGFQYAFQSGYAKEYKHFAEFIKEISRLIVGGMGNGVDDMLGSIYKSFLANKDLPMGRRNPKRLKDW
jgi:hypothetical protein